MDSFDALMGEAEKGAADHPEQAEEISDQADAPAADATAEVTVDTYSSQVDSPLQIAEDSVGG